MSGTEQDKNRGAMRTPGLPEGYDARAEAVRLLRTISAGTLAT